MSGGASIAQLREGLGDEGATEYLRGKTCELMAKGYVYESEATARFTGERARGPRQVRIESEVVDALLGRIATGADICDFDDALDYGIIRRYGSLV